MTFLQRRGGYPSGWRAGRGFTLIELVVTMIVVAIGVALALPSFQNVIRNTAVSNQTNDLVTSLATARAEAVRRGAQASVTANSGGADWSSGWSIRVGANVIATSPAVGNGYHVYAKNAGGSDGSIVFNINGSLVSTGADLNICHPTGDALRSRRIQVRASGMVSSYKGTTGSSATSCPGN